DRPGSLAQQEVDQVLLLRDAPLEVRDRRLRDGDVALGLRYLEPRRDAPFEPVLEQLQRAFARLERVLRDRELVVELAEVEVRLAHARYERDEHAAPGVLGREILRLGARAQAAHASPQIELPVEPEIHAVEPGVVPRAAGRHLARIDGVLIRSRAG